MSKGTKQATQATAKEIYERGFIDGYDCAKVLLLSIYENALQEKPDQNHEEILNLVEVMDKALAKVMEIYTNPNRQPFFDGQHEDCN